MKPPSKEVTSKNRTRWFQDFSAALVALGQIQWMAVKRAVRHQAAWHLFLFEELPANRKVEDGLPQLLDLIGAVRERREGLEGEAGVCAESLGISVRRGEASKAGGSEAVARSFARAARGLEPIQQSHQLIDLGDDAMLFGEGWNPDLNRLQVLS